MNQRGQGLRKRIKINVLRKKRFTVFSFDFGNSGNDLSKAISVCEYITVNNNIKKINKINNKEYKIIIYKINIFYTEHCKFQGRIL